MPILEPVGMALSTRFFKKCVVFDHPFSSTLPEESITNTISWNIAELHAIVSVRVSPLEGGFSDIQNETARV